MNFSRSVFGVKNYHKFYKRDIVFYVEGKKASFEKTRDEIYYEALLISVLGHNSFVIKVVGNKSDVLKHWDQLRQSESKNGVAIIDKDLDGVVSSILPVKNLIYTCGYSWESDFWSDRMLQSIVENLTISNAAASREVASRLNLLAKRLAKISVLDIGGQFNGFPIIKKNKKSCGVNFDGAVNGFISSLEYMRLADIFRSRYYFNCSLTRSVMKGAESCTHGDVIQGHLWENACVNLISAIYKKYTDGKSAPHDIIINIAMSKFKMDPAGYLSLHVISHFKGSIYFALQ